MGQRKEKENGSRRGGLRVRGGEAEEKTKAKSALQFEQMTLPCSLCKKMEAMCQRVMEGRGQSCKECVRKRKRCVHVRATYACVMQKHK